MSREPEEQEPSFMDELRAYLGRSRSWLTTPLLIVVALLVLALIWGSLEALPFVYDIF